MTRYTDQAPTNIILVGFMGTGKSAAAQELAKRLDWNPVDMDHLIEQEQRRSIAAIFQKEGESFFRQVESNTLAKLLLQSKQVIATGGGAVLAESNRQQMAAGGFVVALSASKERIIERVRAHSNRPLLQGSLEERVDKLLAERQDAYQFADVEIDTSELTIEDVADYIMAALPDSFIV